MNWKRDVPPLARPFAAVPAILLKHPTRARSRLQRCCPAANHSRAQPSSGCPRSGGGRDPAVHATGASTRDYARGIERQTQNKPGSFVAAGRRRRRAPRCSSASETQHSCAPRPPRSRGVQVELAGMLRMGAPCLAGQRFTVCKGARRGAMQCRRSQTAAAAPVTVQRRTRSAGCRCGGVLHAGSGPHARGW